MVVSPGWLEDVRELVNQHRNVSPYLLRRRLHIPCRAGERLLGELQKEGIVGPAGPGRSREVLHHG